MIVKRLPSVTLLLHFATLYYTFGKIAIMSQSVTLFATDSL